MLDGDDAKHASYIIRALGFVARVDPDSAKTAVPSLVEMLHGQHARPADVALALIIERNPKELETIVPRVLGMLQANDEPTRSTAERVVRWIAQALFQRHERERTREEPASDATAVP
jgi:hypothetical protein